MGAILLVLAASMAFLAAPGRVEAATPGVPGGTCTIAFGTVAYASSGNTHVQAGGSAEQIDCDPRYPAADSGVAAPNSGASTGGGTWSAVTNVNDNTLTYAPHPRWIGPDTYTMYFCNDVNCTGAGRVTATVNVTVAAPTISLTASLPNGTVATAYSQVLTASGSASPYTFTVISGTLPTGLSLGVVSNPTGTSSTVTLSGTPTAGGTFNFTIRATDNSIGTGPATKDQAYTITMAPPTISVSPTTIPNGTRGTAYSQTLTANGGTAPRTWTVSSGALPAGLTLSTGGVVSGTPTAAGSFTFVARAQDSSTGTGSPYAGTRSYTFSIAEIPPVANASSATVAHNSSANPIPLTITGGAATSVTVTTPALHGTATPSGATISYTPTPGYAGSDSFSYTATNVAGTSAPATVTITVSPPTLVLNPTGLPDGTVGVAYNETTTASGGQSPYTYSISAGALPAGLNINSSTGVISGTPTTTGPTNFTVRAQDSSTLTPFAVTRGYAVDILAPPVAITSPAAGALPGATGGVAYSQTFTSSGGQTPYSFTQVSGSLPAGLTFNTATGVLSGTPTVAGIGTFNFSLTTTDSSPNPGPYTSAPVAYSLVVTAPTITVSPTTLPNATTALAYSQTITATGGTGPHGFTVTSGTLPTGLTLSGAGALSGTPTATGTYNFTVTATDTLSFTGARAYTIVVADPVITLSPAAGALPGATGGVAYSQTITATGGQGTHSFLQAGGALPPGTTLSGAGVLSGTPTAAGTFNFTVTATDASPAPGPFTSAPVAYSVTVTAPVITVSPTTLPAATTALAYSETITATGGTSPHGFTVTAGALPAGLTLSTGGVLSGSPTVAATYNFTVTATDAIGFTGSRAYTVVVADPVITITSPSAGVLPGATGGVAYSQTFTASGGQGGHTFAVTAGALPAGVTLSGAGVLSGTPTVSGTFNFSVTASDSSPAPGPFNSTPVAYSLTVTAPTITVSPTTLPNATTALAYSQTITATGGTGPHGFTVTAGTLPTGLTLSGAGALSGTPTATGNYNFTITATDALGFTGARAYTVAVADPVITLSPAAGALPGATGGVAYSQTITATGGQGTHSFLQAGGALPPGTTLSGAGVLSGTPTAAGTFNFTVTATDASPAPGPFTSAPVAYSVTVTAPVITVSPTTLPAATTALAYSETITATGGTSPHGFTVTAGALPAGLTLSGAGVLSGTPTVAATYNFTVTATDAIGFTGNRAYTVVVADPVITITSPSAGALPGATGGAAYSQTFTASGGQGSHTFAVTAGALPTGVTLSGAGVLSGTPTVSGTFNFSVTASDSSPAPGPFNSAPVAYSLSVSAPAITVSPTTLPNATTAVSYSETITASGGTTPYGFTVTAGTLPTGLTLSGAGVLSGTPTAAATYNFTVTATDTYGFTGNRAYTVIVADPVITITSPSAGPLAGGTGGTAYSQTFTASGGQGSHTFAVTAGALPPGTTLSGTGVLSGTPTAAGTFNFTVRATDASPGPGGPFNSTPVAYSLTITAPATTVSPTTLPNATTAVSYSETITASGGTTPYGFTVTAGTLPVGLTLGGSGGLSGTPTAAGTYNFTVTATDTYGFTGNRAYTVIVADPVITITSPSAGALPGGTGGTAYSQTFTASGGQGTHSFSLMAGALPVGMSFSSAGVLSGTPTVAGTFNFTIRASDASPGPAGPFNSAPVAYSLTIAAPSVTISPASLPAATTAVAYSQTVTASGGTTPYSFSILSGALPIGTSFNSGGVLSGTPSVAGTYNFTVRATDTHGFTGDQAYSIVVSDPVVTINPPFTLPQATGGVAYNTTITAAGGQSPHSFSLTSGTLPVGMSFNSAGVLSGTPTVAGTFNFTLVASDSSPAVNGGPFSSAPETFTLVVNAPTVTVSPGSLPGGPTAAAYSQTVTAGGGTAPYSFSLLSGSLPIGTSFNSGGVLSGTPSAAGTYNFTVRATDTHGFTGDQAYTVVITDPTITVTAPAAGALPAGTGGVAYSQTFTASGGQGAHTFNLAGGGLPPGLALSSGGVLSGTPTTAGTYNFSVTANDSSPAPGPFTSAPVAYSIVINAPTITITPPTLPGGLITVPYSQAFAASGGTAPYAFSVTAGGLPPGLALSGAGVLSGTPTLAGTYNFTVTATDALAFTQAQAYSLVIGTPIPVAAPQTATVVGGQSVTIAVTTGATGSPYTAVTVATAPAHGTAVVSGQTVIYTANGAYAGTDSFTYTLTNAGGVSAPATVTITVNPAVVPAPPKTVTILAGQTAVVELTAGATGGPFTAATVVSLTPPASGQTTVTARAIPGGQAFDLSFKPDNSFAGTAVVSYTLSNAFATSAPGTVTIIVQARPDPSQDPEVAGLVTAQNEAARRFATAQLSNINRRLERLHGENAGSGFSSSLGFSGGQTIGEGFGLDPTEVRQQYARLGLFEGIATPPPPPIDRRGADAGKPSFGFDNEKSPWGVWVSGSANFGRRDDGANREGFKFTTDGLTLGTDYRIGERFVLGVGLGFAHDSSRIGDNGTRTKADAYSISLYGSYQPTATAYLDAVLGYGMLDFDSQRYVTSTGGFAYGQRDGDQWFGSLTAGLEHRNGPLHLSPYGRIEGTRSKLSAFTETGGGPFALTYDEQTAKTLTGAIGVRGDYTVPTSFGSLIPGFRFEYSYDFKGSGLARLRYADWIGGPSYTLPLSPFDKDRFLLGISLDAIRKGGMRFGIDYEGMLSGDGSSQNVRILFETSF